MTGDDRPAAGGCRDGAHDEAEPSAATCEDRALLRRLRAGEDAAFGELFSRHCDAVRRLARGMVTDRAEAEDLTAEAFFRVLQAIRRGSGPVDNVRGYLLIVVRRVAWEWAGRRRDVPVTDEELDYRAGPELDDPGRSTERSLITRAFTSLPERWRSVLWKVEVEGERPAVVAGKFGLSPNATAALARRARQGLRAAYLQAHLATERGSVGCRAALEKLGAYTAGSIKGTERRKVRAHLQVCPSCTDMQAELQDVCAGLRAHAAFLTVPVAGLALAQQAAAPAGLLAGAKAVLTGVKFQVAAAAASAAAVGAFTLLPLGHVDGQPDAFADLDGTAPTLVVTSGSPAPVGTTGATDPPTAASSAIRIEAGHDPSAGQPPPGVGREPERERTPAPPVPPVTDPAPTSTTTRTPEGRDEGPTVLDAPVDDYDDTLPVVSRQVSQQRKWWVYDQYDVISEVSTTTLVNAADQTTVSTSTSEYTRYRAPGGTTAPTPMSGGAGREAPEAPTVTRTPSG